MPGRESNVVFCTSLNMQLPALGRLISHAAKRTQVWVVSHARRLVATLEEDEGCHSIELDKSFGESVIRSQGALDEPQWKWPDR